MSDYNNQFFLAEVIAMRYTFSSNFMFIKKTNLMAQTNRKAQDYELFEVFIEIYLEIFERFCGRTLNLFKIL